MKILIDTNVLISAAINPGGTAAKAYFKATAPPYESVLCDYCIEEFKRIVRNKFPQHIPAVDAFLSTALLTAKIAAAPPHNESICGEEYIRDPKDQPIIRAAVIAKADVILTGDKDFLESGIKRPQCLSPAEFLLVKCVTGTVSRGRRNRQ